MLAWTLLLLAVALVGHAAFWVGLVNRWHAIGFSRPTVKTGSFVFYTALLTIPLAVLAFLAGSPPSADELRELNWATAYIAFCGAYGAAHLPLWSFQRWQSGRLPHSVRPQANHVVDIAQRLGFAPACGVPAKLFCRIPGNQLWQLHVSDVSIDMPGLSPSLDGLSICHWSDLHFSGRVAPAYFHEVTRLTNEMDVDLLVLTGDVCDAAHTIPWVSETLGAARARLGKFFILGNHDLRTRDVARLRDAMREIGFVDLGGRHEVIHDGQIVIAGDERPWFKSPPEAVDVRAGLRDNALKILLAHTPDRLRWARAHGFDLMLAGHTHGGQIRLPWIGPLVCPSWHGVKYAGGFFHEPPTLMHVSRGTGSLLPLRINCPPEMTKLVLHRPELG